MVNRSAIILKYKQPVIDWINSSDPVKKPSITLDYANKDRTVYLIHEDESENFERWISANFLPIFESELEDWYTDESLWPKKRTRTIFNKWFDVECHSVLIDTVGGSIFDDEI
jgi:hypothetical protein